jgi:2-hydroxy-3-oxopropionate reductase
VKRRLGFIGLGKMGYWMTRHLLRAGHSVTVYDVMPEAIERLIEFEASPAGSPREVGERSEVVMTMVPADRDVEAAVLGDDGVLSGLRSGSTLVQMATIKPSTIHKIAPFAAAKGVRLLDAPVSMGHFVADAKLSVYVGGDREVFEEIRPLFEAMGTDIMHVGPLGTGQACKLVNNYASMTNTIVAAEALLMGLKAGIDPDVLHRVVNTGSGGSVAWRDKVPMMLARNFEPQHTFTTDLAHKDISLAVEMAGELQSPVLLGSLAKELYNAARQRGQNKQHYCSAVTILEAMAGIVADGEVTKE